MKRRTVKSAEGRRTPVWLCQPFVRKHRRLKHRPTLGLCFMSEQSARIVEVKLGAFWSPIPTTHLAHMQVLRKLCVLMSPFPHGARRVVVCVHPVVRMVGTTRYDVAQLVAKLQHRQHRPNAHEEHGGTRGSHTAPDHGAKLGASPVSSPHPRSQVCLTSRRHEALP